MYWVGSALVGIDGTSRAILAASAGPAFGAVDLFSMRRTLVYVGCEESSRAAS
jgi:hypothetical protein